MTKQDVEASRAEHRERYHRRTVERRAKGLCVKCSKRPPTSGRCQCEPCLEKRRATDRVKYAAAKAAG